MSTTENLLKEAEASAKTNPKHAEELYKQILSTTAGEFTIIRQVTAI